MSETVNTIDSEQGAATGQKPKISFTVAVILLVILTIISIVLLSLRLHDFIYVDDKEVGLKSGLEHNLDLFSIVYRNNTGDIVVSGAEGEKVIAPGTSVEYTLRLRNKDTRALDYQVHADMEFLSQHELPLKVRLLDNDDNYILGSPTEWADISELKGVACTDTILTEESHEFIFQWKWAFDGEDDAYDTFLGNVAEENVGIEVSMSVYAAVNTSMGIDLMDSIWVDLFFVLLVLIIVTIAIILLVLPPLRKYLAEKKAAKLAAEMAAEGIDVDGEDLNADVETDTEAEEADAEADETDAEPEEIDTGDQAE